MKASIKTYAQLLTFVKPYKIRLLIGLVAGFMTGGSLFGVLHFSPKLVQPFKMGAEQPKDKGTSTEVARAREIAAWLNIPATMPDGAISWQFMLLTMIGLPICLVAKSVCAFVNRYCMRWIGSRVVVDIRNQLFANLQRQSLRFYGKQDIGGLISRCVNDTLIVQSALSSTIADITRAPIELLTAAIFIMAFSVEHDVIGLAVTMYLVFPLCVMPVFILGQRIKKYTRKSLEKISELVSRMHENFTSIRVIKAFHTESYEEERFRRFAERYFRQILKASMAELLMPPMMEIVGVVGICAFLSYCYVIKVPLEQILPMVAAALFAYGPVKNLAQINSRLQQSVAAAERIFELLKLDTGLREAPNPKRVDGFRDKIVFDHVGFSYGATDQFELNDISFELKKGELIAFVGESGAGKTTIANLLARLYDVDTGAITMDGVDLRQLEIASLRSKISIVSQDTILFNDTVAFNISYGSPGVAMDRIVAAAQQANAHGFITAEAEGYGRMVGDKGFRLSGGERQRIAIARAILRNPDLLILDEATSALDSVTEQLVREAIDRLMKDRTVFAIAHRLSTVRRANRIYVVDQGRIVEQGSHEELLASGGRYKTLYDMQFEGLSG